MTPKGRFLKALDREPTDRVPLFDFLFQRPMFTELIGRTPDAYNARDAMDLTRALGLDGVWIPYGCFSGWSPEQLAENVYRDEWGTTFESNESSWPIDAPIDYPLRDPAALAGYAPPDPAAPGRLTDIETAVAMNRDWGDEAVAILGGVGGPLTVTWMLVGYEDICLQLYGDPDFLRRVAQFAGDFGVVAIDRMAAAGVDAMIVSEDLGSSTGPLLSPRHYREVFNPVLAQLIERAQAHGLPTVLHCCGRCYDFLDDMVELRLNALHALQRTAGMDLARVKTSHGDRLTLIGNIDSSRTLPYGSAADIEAEVREAIRAAGPGGGYILGSDHSLHDGISVDAIRTLFTAARKYGCYPIEA